MKFLAVSLASLALGLPSFASVSISRLILQSSTVGGAYADPGTGSTFIPAFSQTQEYSAFGNYSDAAVTITHPAYPGSATVAADYGISADVLTQDLVHGQFSTYQSVATSTSSHSNAFLADSFVTQTLTFLNDSECNLTVNFEIPPTSTRTGYSYSTVLVNIDSQLSWLYFYQGSVVGPSSATVTFAPGPQEHFVTVAWSIEGVAGDYIFQSSPEAFTDLRGSMEYRLQAVPEPSSLIAFAMFGLGFVRKRKAKTIGSRPHGFNSVS